MKKLLALLTIFLAATIFFSCSKAILDTSTAASNSSNASANPNTPYCDPGYHWDFFLSKCVPICSTGYHNDSITGACVPDGSSAITQILNDPDWQTIANALHTYYDIFVNNKINVKTYDLTNNALFLQTTGLTQAQLNTLVQNVKTAGQRLVARYHFDPAKCPACSASFSVENAAFDSVIISFQNSPSLYASFTSQSLGIGYGQSSKTNLASQPCCGWWFYACCALAAETIEAFPVYLAACCYCYHAECCGNSKT